MKKLIVLSAMTFVLAAAGNAQTNEASLKNEIKTDKKEESAIKKEKQKEKKELRKLEGKEVSYHTQDQFARDFGDIPGVKWTRSAYYDVAVFTKDGQTSKAYYDYDSELVGTTTLKTFEDIPLKAQNYINQKYKGYSKDAIILFDDNELNETDMIMYDQQFEDADNYFVELNNGSKRIVLQVDMKGNVSFFRQLS